MSRIKYGGQRNSVPDTGVEYMKQYMYNGTHESGKVRLSTENIQHDT